jgi:cell division protein FtsI (penicillin-binding protein 3)
VSPRKRLGACTILVVVVFGLLAARIGQLQLMSGDKYKRLAVAATVRKVPLSAERGSVFDRNGRDLAMSIRRTTVYADPKFVIDPAATAALLAPIVKVDEATLLARLSDKGTPQEPRRFAYIARTVSDDVAAAVDAVVKEKKLPGIGFVPESSRSYPAGSVGGSLVGNVRSDGVGNTGIEYLYDKMLTGKPGELVVEQDPLGHDIPNTPRSQTDAERGTDIVLTIDESMQYETEYSLLDQVIGTQAKGGMAVVVDVTTGDVLSMATVLGADGKQPARVAGPGERNMPLSDLYEPGSTSKLITLGWAIEHGLVTPDTMFTVPDHIKVHPEVDAYTDHDGHPDEQWTTSDIMRESSNVGTIMIADKMSGEDLEAAQHAFGFGKKSNIDWPGQPAGWVKPASEYWASGKYSSAIGYGASVTGMQVLGALTTIANDGVSRPARLLDATIDEKGDRHRTETPAGERVVSSATAAQMRTMLAGVVTRGTGACAAVRGFTVGGKTGTSKKIVGNGYSETASMASFEGFAPADNPRFAALVVLDEPLTQYQFGGTAAAPVFSEIMGFALNQYGVAANDPGDAQYNQATATAAETSTPCAVPHGPALQERLAELAAQAQAAAEADAETTDDQDADTGDSGTETSGTESSGTGDSQTTTDSLPANRSEQN